jgi:hypothetical protein
MEKINKDLIASCGMNCGVCRAYLREKNHCPGCNYGPEMKSCLHCFIRQCDKRKGDFCFSCAEFPCQKLKHLDKRYRTKYDMSEIGNLENIRDNGIEKFVESQEKKYISFRGIKCVHDKKYYK